MGGAPYLAVIYRNAAVVRLAGRFAGVTRDARALQRCRELAKGAADAPGGAEMAVGKALWDAEAGYDWMVDGGWWWNVWDFLHFFYQVRMI